MKKTFILIPLFILILSINIITFSESFYVEKNNDILYYEEEVKNLLNYFQGEELDKTRYSEREILHLEDVQHLIQTSLILMTILFLIITYNMYTFSKKERKKQLIKGGLFSLLVVGLLSFVFTNFALSFQRFHEIFFRNDLWLLPPDATLILLFPESFFFTAMLRIVLYSLMFSVLLIIIGIIPKKVKKW